MKKITYGIIGIISLMLALGNIDNDSPWYSLPFLFIFMWGMQKAGVINWMEEINKDY